VQSNHYERNTQISTRLHVGTVFISIPKNNQHKALCRHSFHHFGLPIRISTRLNVGTAFNSIPKKNQHKAQCRQGCYVRRCVSVALIALPDPHLQYLTIKVHTSAPLTTISTYTHTYAHIRTHTHTSTLKITHTHTHTRPLSKSHTLLSAGRGRSRFWQLWQTRQLTGDEAELNSPCGALCLPLSSFILPRGLSTWELLGAVALWDRPSPPAVACHVRACMCVCMCVYACVCV